MRIWLLLPTLASLVDADQYRIPDIPEGTEEDLEAHFQREDMKIQAEIAELEKLEKNTGKPFFVSMVERFDRSLLEHYMITKEWDPTPKEIDNWVDSDGYNSVFHSVMAGTWEMTEFLCWDRKASVEVMRGHMTPLMLASLKGDGQNVKALLRHNATVDRFNSNGENALLFAMQGGHASVAKLLADSGSTVAINYSDIWKTTLMLLMRSSVAADKANLELVQFIIKNSDEKQRIYQQLKEFVETTPPSDDADSTRVPDKTEL